MPRVETPQTDRDREFEAAMARQQEFLDTGWHRNARGNFTKQWFEFRATVFWRNGKWHFVYQSDDEEPPVFSRHGYEHLEDAKIVLGEHLDVWPT